MQNANRVSYKDIKKMPNDTKILLNELRLDNLEYLIERYYNDKPLSYFDKMRLIMIRKIDRNPKYRSKNDRFFVELPAAIVLFLFKYAPSQLKKCVINFYIDIPGDY